MIEPKFKVGDHVFLARTDIRRGKHGTVVEINDRAWGVRVRVDGFSNVDSYHEKHLDHDPVVDRLARLLDE